MAKRWRLGNMSILDGVKVLGLSPSLITSKLYFQTCNLCRILNSRENSRESQNCPNLIDRHTRSCAMCLSSEVLDLTLLLQNPDEKILFPPPFRFLFQIRYFKWSNDQLVNATAKCKMLHNFEILSSVPCERWDLWYWCAPCIHFNEIQFFTFNETKFLQTQLDHFC